MIQDITIVQDVLLAVVHVKTASSVRARLQEVLLSLFITLGVLLLLDVQSTASLSVLLVDWCVVLDKLGNWDDALSVPLDLLIEMVGLKLCQDLDHCSLQSGSSHQSFVIWSSKSLLSNLNSLDWLHSVLDLVVLLAHEVSLGLGGQVRGVSHVEDEDVSLLLEVDLVQDLDRWLPGVDVVVEVRDVLPGKSVELVDFHHSRDCSLERNFISVIQLHQEDMQEVNDDQHEDSVVLDLVSLHEEAHQGEVDQKQEGVSG